MAKIFRNVVSRDHDLEEQKQQKYSLSSLAYEVPITSWDYGGHTKCSVSFNEDSFGQLAMVIYEWGDRKYLGRMPHGDGTLPWKTYVCTSPALERDICTEDEFGRFIIDLPDSVNISDTSFWSGRLILPNNSTRYEESSSTRSSGVVTYKEPIRYAASSSGYYCVAIEILVVTDPHERGDRSPVRYTGSILFQNAFKGRLPGEDYPKLCFYGAMLLTYLFVGALWARLCWLHWDGLLSAQLSGKGKASRESSIRDPYNWDWPIGAWAICGLFAIGVAMAELDPASARLTIKEVGPAINLQLNVLPLSITLCIFLVFTFSSVNASSSWIIPTTEFVAANWKTSWLLIDGWRELNYFVFFSVVAFLWRPSAQNTQILMSEELPQDGCAEEGNEPDDAQDLRDNDNDNRAPGESLQQ
ncbi:hypothetical protein K488DRAFT_71768 [Vararia minispora EC-137]|uniref:Uncharacterized protein n=1 Tax=Vararia minispora EC-137 TaxID=1314806 RepID=A0ACB8QH43_9AGAM|nr:hypothetical protein K488DRAFT_71768 [Vararia minispora EC-137]